MKESVGRENFHAQTRGCKGRLATETAVNQS